MSTSGGIPPISQLASTPNPTSQLPGTQSTSSGSTLGANAFLQLLTTELQNQDPTSPQDATQSVTQLAQFSSLQYQQQLTSAFQGFSSNFGVLQASSLLGKQVTVGITDSSGNSSTTTGTINSIDVQNGVPYFTMVDSSGNPVADSTGKPYLFSLTQIIGIGTGGSTGTGGTGSSGSGGNGSGSGAGGSGGSGGGGSGS